MNRPSIIIGCEESGTIRDAFIRAGFYAVSCDLQPSRAPGPHIQGDIFDVLGAGWDMMIVHPPCTYLSSSGLHWNKNPKSPRFGGRQTDEALEFVRRVWSAPVKHKVMENPIGCIGTRLGLPHSQVVQPYEFGDDASKATCLWLEGLPPLVKDPAKRFPGRIVTHNGKQVERWSNQTDSGQNRLPPSEFRARDRSVTYKGIADAMVAQWGPILRKVYR